MSGDGVKITLYCTKCTATAITTMPYVEAWLAEHKHDLTPWQEEAQQVIDAVQKYEDEHPAALLSGTPCFASVLRPMREALEHARHNAIEDPR